MTSYLPNMKRLFLLIFFIFSNLIFAKDELSKVRINTNFGEIIVELNDIEAPITVANFLKYVKQDFYKNTIIHRIEPNFVIQGGGYDVDLNEKNTNSPIANESHNGLQNKKYTIAMARTNNPHSATSQFFINLADNDFLNADLNNIYGYTVFGRVIKGFNVVDKIAKVPVKNSFLGSSTPAKLVEIHNIELIKQEQ